MITYLLINCLPPKKCVAYNTSILKVNGRFFSYFRMNKSMLIMVLLIVVVLCSVFVFADPIPIPPKYSSQHLKILCPMQKNKGFVTAQCRKWFKNWFASFKMGKESNNQSNDAPLKWLIQQWFLKCFQLLIQ